MQYGEIIDDYYDMILGFWENGFTLQSGGYYEANLYCGLVDWTSGIQ
jgi:hypothetical protein